MSNAVQFLETMGRNQMLSRMSPLDYASAVAALDIDDLQRDALMQRNHDALNEVLGGRKKMLFAVFPAEEEEPQKDDDGDAPAEDAPPESE